MPKRLTLYQLVPQRIQRVRRDVAAAVWKQIGPVTVTGSEVLNEPVPVAAAARLRYRPVTPGSHFGPARGGWSQRWFALQVQPPPRGVTRHLFWRCQGETTVYHRGQPWAGLDVCHASCPVPPSGGKLLLDCGTYQTAIWVREREEIGGHGLRFDGAHLADREETAWQARLDLEIMVQLLEHLLARNGWKSEAAWHHKPDFIKAEPLLRVVLEGLAAAADAWDRGGVGALRRSLAALYRALPAEAWQPRATMVGSSHLDLVWMWPEREGERKGVHTIATMLRLLERYPEFRVTWTQPALMDALRKRAPGLVRAVQRQVRAGRWEFTGGMEVEAENQVPCGEALVRTLVYGQRRLAALRGGVPSTVVWLPDCFGFAGCLPQLMTQTGLTGFYTSKMGWNQITPFPHTSFVWRGSDGSEVVAHQTPMGGATVDTLVEAAERDRQSAVTGEFLGWVGIGDGGGGTTEEQIERLRRLNNLANVPRASWGRAEEFFARLEAKRDQLPVLQGELHLEYHRGTYTTQAPFKAAYRELERALQAHEAARALTGGKALGFAAWKRLLFAQFHDALPGSSIQLVYDEMTPELRRLAAEHRQAAARQLRAKGQGWTVFNPLPLARRCVVDLGANVPARLAGVVATQRSGRRTLALVDLPAAGSVVLKPAEGPSTATAVQASPTLLANGVVQARFDARGRLQALRVEGRALPLTKPAGLLLHRDRPANFDAWDMDREDMLTGQEVTAMTLRVAEAGPVRAVLVGEAGFGAASRLTLRYILEAGSRWLRVEADMDWHETSRFLKYRVATACQGRMARFGTPFGSILRPQLPGHPQEEAMWEVTGNRWAAVLDDAQSNGVALVAEAKYGFSCREGELALTLLRGPVDSDEAHPQRVDQGRHPIRFAIGSATDNAAAAAETLFGDVVVVPGTAVVAPAFELANAGSLVASWLTPSESGQGVILRLHETAGKSGVAEIRAAGPVTRVDLLERSMGKLVRGQIVYRPYEVISLLLNALCRSR